MSAWSSRAAGGQGRYVQLAGNDELEPLSPQSQQLKDDGFNNLPLSSPIGFPVPHPLGRTDEPPAYLSGVVMYANGSPPHSPATTVVAPSAPLPPPHAPVVSDKDVEVDVKGKDVDGDSDTLEDEPGAMRMRELGEENVEFPGLKREQWWQLWRPKNYPPRPRKSLADAPVTPLANANVWSMLTFHWVSPLMRLGYQRPLQATDLWKVDETREANHLSTIFLAHLEKRQAAAAAWNIYLADVLPSWKVRVKWAYTARTKRTLPANFKEYGTDETYAARMATLEAEWRAKSGKMSGSITWALNDTFPNFWYGGIFKVASDVAQMMGPLLIKALINFSKETYAATHGPEENRPAEPNIGRGIGLAIGLFCLTLMQSVCQHQFFFRSMQTGALARAALISATYKRALKLSVGARSKQPNGKLMAYLSSDISRIDFCAQWFHAIWTAPIQLALCLILLCLQIGPSAILGFAMFILLAPLQTYFMKTAFKVRKASMKWTDGRSNLLQELLASMQVIKVFTYEIPFLKRLADVRKNEMHAIRKILFIRAGNQAMAFSIPALAAVLSFSVYSATHAGMDPALIFTSLAFFNLLRQPLMFFPRALSTLTDAQTAIQRLTELFDAEVAPERSLVDPTLDVAVRAKDASFKWAVVQEPESLEGGKGKGGKGGKKEKRGMRKLLRRRKKDKDGKPVEAKPEAPAGEPFAVEHLNLEVQRGKLVAIVGPVGSGKSSILQGLLGEMRSLGGTVAFGGSLGYCQQSAWIQNATLRDNILFGQKWDEERYWECIQKACLIPDLEIMADGDLTEIGEKGVSLSGGQKQRVNIARALYFDSDIVLFDDPLSAVDAHVGKSLFEDAIMGLRAKGKTVLLVTHALHFLPQVDYIYTIDGGMIVEEGTYEALMSTEGAFHELMEEFGGAGAEKEEEEEEEEEAAIAEMPPKEQEKAVKAAKQKNKAAGTGKLEGRLMVSEKRKTGSVGKEVYAAYLRAGKAQITGPLVLIFAATMQTAQVMSTVWLTYWESNKFQQSLPFYQGIYALLGLSQAVFTFGLGMSMGFMNYFASRNLYGSALKGVFFAPMSFFDTNPLGRIMGIFGKDVDTVDNQLAEALRMQAMTLISLIGSVIVISVWFPVFVAVIFVVGIGYYYFALFYRTSAREVKRLDGMLRGLLYAHFSESLSGLATIRAYGETNRFVNDNAYYMDLEDRAYLLTAGNQRWLAVRLDFLGACLVFAVGVMAAKGGGGIGPAQIALCLTYMTQITQVLGMVTRQSAEVENALSSVERLMFYSDGKLPQEAAYEDPNTDPGDNWPQQGRITFRNVVMSYREGLPPVLKGISAEFRAGEKVGIIGRTGAGKTSITVALYRLAELSSGNIYVDGADIATLGLRDLRSRIAVIPQDPVLFSGTLRSNLDPFHQHQDAALYDALQRACLGPAADGSRHYTLDTPIEEGGSNLSIGERSLVSLARALVKDSKIVVLDEATAAVDLSTDAQIQRTIRSEFTGRTLLCIAHRLRTIIGWDRILVMNAGEVDSFDTPLSLFDQGGLFRELCDRSNISREEVIAANAEERAPAVHAI